MGGYGASQSNEMSSQSEKASLPLFLTQSLVEVKAGSSGGIKGLIWKGDPPPNTPIVNGKPENAYF